MPNGSYNSNINNNNNKSKNKNKKSGSKYATIIVTFDKVVSVSGCCWTLSVSQLVLNFMYIV